MSEIGVLVLAETLDPADGPDRPLARVDVRARAGRRRVADRRAGRRARPRLAGRRVGRPDLPAVGALVGAINGLLIVRFQLNGFIVTLGMLITLRGSARRHQQGPDVLPAPAVDDVARPDAVVAAAGVGVAVALPVRRRDIRPRLHAARAARCTRSGATSPPRRPPVSAPTASSGGRSSSAASSPRSAASCSAGAWPRSQPSQGSGAIFTVFAAAVIGGVSLNGGKGSVFGAFTGVLLLFMIRNVLTLAGVARRVDRLPERCGHPRGADRLARDDRAGAGLEHFARGAGPP